MVKKIILAPAHFKPELASKKIKTSKVRFVLPRKPSLADLELRESTVKNDGDISGLRFPDLKTTEQMILNSPRKLPPIGKDVLIEQKTPTPLDGQSVNRKGSPPLTTQTNAGPKMTIEKTSAKMKLLPLKRASLPPPKATALKHKGVQIEQDTKIGEENETDVQWTLPKETDKASNIDDQIDRTEENVESTEEEKNDSGSISSEVESLSSLSSEIGIGDMAVARRTAEIINRHKHLSGLVARLRREVLTTRAERDDLKSEIAVIRGTLKIRGDDDNDVSVEVF